MIPRNELNSESKINACNGCEGEPTGWGTRSTMAWRISSTPKPVLPLASMISSRLQPISSITWSFTSSGMAFGMSILFNTGMISKLFSTARYRLDMV